MSGFYTWSRTASANASADNAVNWAEGMAPSAVNDSGRGMMASAAKWRDDIAGALVTSGSSTAYTITSYQGFDTLAHLDGQQIAFTPHDTNGATVTLAVDGLGAKPLRSAPGVDLPAAMLIAGSPYVATYYSGAGEFVLQGFYTLPEVIPVGGCIPYLGATVPNNNFAFPFGQTFSRTVYSKLFALVGTKFGSGDGSTTFNGPDIRGRAFFGLDNMGGAAANRITSGGSGIAGTTLGATGGLDSYPLARSQLPNVTLSLTADGSTATNVLRNVGQVNVSIPFPDGGIASPPLFNPGSVAVSVTGTTSSINGNVTQVVTNNMPPTFICPVIMRII
ncbi:tail fiber protein [Bradyrhizobium sp. SYSU BS000235]|uniref:tail fiber protein n=1 Tax=Bradyrhizobium sp. SYSU BS000235 TaxID=3411332 RepID=UPI003C7431ED